MKQWKIKQQIQMQPQSKSNTNSIVIMISITVIVVGLFWIVMILNDGKSGSDVSNQTEVEIPINNVSVVDGQQIIEIAARGGYSPQKTIAKANIPTVIKFKTNGTYDCSSAVRIPSLNLSENLPGTGETEMEIGSQPAGKLSGSCSMGMYFFEIDFQA